MAFEQLEPFGDRIETWRAGQICAVIANVNRPKGKRAYRPADFFELGDEGGGVAVESSRSIWAKCALLTEAFKVHKP